MFPSPCPTMGATAESSYLCLNSMAVNGLLKDWRKRLTSPQMASYQQPCVVTGETEPEQGQDHSIGSDEDPAKNQLKLA